MTNSKKKRRKRKRKLPPKTSIWSDGSASSTKDIGAGYVFMRWDGDEFICYGVGAEPPGGKVTNNMAEVSAIRLGVINMIAHNKPRRVTFYSDSQYAIGVLFEGNKVRANKDLVYDTLDLIESLISIGSLVRGIHVPRTTPQIKACDKYAGLFRKRGEFMLKTVYAE